MGIGGAHPGGLLATKYVLNEVSIPRGLNILDVGCGTGQTAAFLEKQYEANVTALDNHEMMVEKALKRKEQEQLTINVVNGNVEALPFADDSFDMVISESVLAFTNVSKAISEICRVLKDDGIFYCIEMVLEKSSKELNQITDFYGMEKIFKEEEWVSLLQNAGFKMTNSKTFEYDIHQITVDDAPEFQLSESVDDAHVDTLLEHDYLTKQFQKELGFRIFHCKL